MAPAPLALRLLLLINLAISDILWNSNGCITGQEECVCSGTYNGRTLAGYDRIEDLRTMYENCTRVRGNLEITHLTMETIKDSNISLSEKLKIFQYVEEIKGYLLIYNVDFDILWFPNLKIIWGDRLFEDHTGSRGAALMMSGNHHLKEIHMPKLRTVHNGDVLIENNTNLCYLKEKVNWNELLNMDSKRLLIGHDAFRDCYRYNFTECHSTCTSNHCWGKSASNCQSLYRTGCPEQCGSTDSFGEKSAPQCYYNETEKMHKCCNQACEGGCTGGLDTDCMACKRFKLGNSCVSSCPPLMIMSRKDQKMVFNPNGTYTDDRYCVKQCSVNMLIQDGHCVRHCSEGFYHDVNKDTRICEKCPSEGCPAKACEVNEALTREILATLEGCEIINGFLKIAGPKMQRPDTAFTVNDLYVLRKVRIVSEFVYMVTSTLSPTNMSFLENLEVIEGRALDTERYALVISQNDNLRELGLKKLKKIKAGDIHIRDNHSLCFASTVNWTASIVSKATDIKIGSNMNDETCKRRKKICDQECNQLEGCWGAGPKMCVKCASWKLNDTCVNQCPTEGYFEDEETHECRPCFEQCLQCKGPKKSDCISCKNFSLRENNRLTCLKECGKRHYSLLGECFPCHESCYDYGCSGPKNTLGDEGCNMCRYALIVNAETVEQCLYTDGSQHQVCEDNNFTHHYVSSKKIEGVELVHCKECDDVCQSCTSGGNEIKANGCVCQDYIIIDGNVKTCKRECPSFSQQLEEKGPNGPGTCRMCHEFCDRNFGCDGPLATDCKKCANGSIETDGKDECVKACTFPKQYLAHVDDRKICSEVDIDKNRRHTKRLLIGIGIVVVLLVFIIIGGGIFKFLKQKNKLDKLKFENGPEIPEEIQMSAVRPNMNRVNLISRNEVQKTTRKLGNGAFGVVYAGYWYPKGPTGKKVPVAIKVVSAIGKIKAQEESAMLDEAAKMAQLRHQHLLRLVGICLKDDGVELVTPLRLLGSLLNYLRRHNEKISGKYLLIYCYQIASAMKYLAENNLVHRDLAARNVLVKKHDHVEVTDFGLSKFIAYGESEVKVDQRLLPIKWIPPEVWDTSTYTSQSDVWSYGITCWEILTYGGSPYQGMQMQAVRDYIYDGNRLEQPRNCSTQLYQILLQCWMMSADSRPSFGVLHERFREFCKIPNCYVTNSVVESASFDNDIDQEKELRELMNDDSGGWENIENPLTYFDLMDTDSLVGQAMPRGARRLTSTSSMSHRYHTDPMSRPNMLAKSVSIGLEDNYLVPDSKLSEQQAILYTPVFVNENGGTELLETEYYNDQKPSSSKDPEYYNESTPFNKQDSVLRKIQEESEEVEKESCL